MNKKYLYSASVLATLVATQPAFAEDVTEVAQSTEAVDTRIDQVNGLKAEEHLLESKISNIESKIQKAEDQLSQTQQMSAKVFLEAEAKSLIAAAEETTSVELNEDNMRLSSLKVDLVTTQSKLVNIETELQKEADEKAKKEAEIQAKKEAEELAKKEAEEKAKQEAEAAERAALEAAAAIEQPIATYQQVTNTTTNVATTTPTAGSLNTGGLTYDYAGASSYPVGQCTWGVKVLAPWAGAYWGNGAQWAASAAAAGFRTGSVPQVGAIASWNDGGYGHVGYVIAVAENGQIQVMEANVNGNQSIANHRGWIWPTMVQGTVTYIYPN